MADPLRLVSRTEVDFAPGENTWGLKIYREVRHDPTGKERIYWKYGLPHGVQVIGLTLDGQIIAIEEFQVGIEATYLHLVGGYPDESEAPEETARRELLEETGYRAGEMQLLASVFENTSKSDRQIHMFLGLECEKVQEAEKGIKVVVLDPAAFWDRLMDYFSTPGVHGGSGTLQTVTLAYHKLGLMKPRRY